ncbi:MAG: hypothetical protein ACXWLH_06545, partial [Candidatus Saccharimonadales bacterium]
MRQKVLRLIRTASAALLILPVVSVSNAAASDCLSCGDTSSLFGQTQAYDVLLRGNGEAVVNARIDLTNNDSPSISKLSYNIVKGQLEEVTAYQEITCTDLPIIRPANSAAKTTIPSPAGTSASAADTTNYATSTTIPECYPSMEEHPLNNTTVPSASQPLYYYPSGYTYKKIEVSKSGNTLDLKLPESVKKSKDATIVMLYSLSGVSDKSLGAYHYDFKTLKSPSPVSDVTVAVSVDENYVLNDSSKSKVNYRSATSSTELKSSLSAGVSQGANSAADQYVNNIGTTGDNTKHASSLAPNETFTVSGKFATSAWILNWPRTLIKIIIALLLIAALVYWYRRNKRQLYGEKYNLKQEDITAEPQKETPASNKDPEPAKSAVESESVTEEYVPQPVSRWSNSGFINVKALPFYHLAITITRHFRERRVRPMFMAWLCGILGLALISGVVIAAGGIESRYTNSYSYSYSTPI